MQRGLVWSVSASLAGLAVMGLVATVVQPPRVPLADLPHHVGQTIRIDGWVLDPRTSAAGWTRFLVSDGNNSVAMVGTDIAPLTAGDLVECDGVVEQVGPHLDVRLETSDAVRVVRPWREHHVALAQLAQAPWAWTGGQFVTSGVIQAVGSQVRLVDPSGLAYFRTSGLNRTSDEGVSVVQARLDYEAATTSYRLVVLDVGPA